MLVCDRSCVFKNAEEGLLPHVIAEAQGRCGVRGII